MPERRYSDEEVQRILAAAAESDVAGSTARPAQRGMTLAEIQQIASEATVSPAAVAAAAATLDAAPPVPAAARVLGLRTGVGQTVTLPRALGEAEWRRLVAYLRNTFEAQGRESEVAGRREWRNGNLRISVEPLGDTALLQMRTRKDNARGLVRGGSAFLVGAVATELLGVLTHTGPDVVSGGLTMGVIGVMLTAGGLLQLPGWSAARRKQFQSVAEYALRLSSGADV